MPGVLRLLHPEWQGYGVRTDSYFGAIALARAWFGQAPHITIDAPADERLVAEDDVLGLASIADRLTHALSMLREAAPDAIHMAAGTCACELAPISYLNDRYGGDLAVLWLDGHADLNTPASSPSKHMHGMVLRALLGDGAARITTELPRALHVNQVALVGARDLDAPEADFIQESRLANFGIDVFTDSAPLLSWLHRVGHRRLYVHFDVDVIDPSDFGGALMAAPPDGPTLHSVAALIAKLVETYNVVGLSVLEVCDRGDSVQRIAEKLQRLND
jgi:arginase